MSRYLLIESRDPYETREVGRDYELASNLVEEGNEVTLFLVQNGVLAARGGAKKNGLADAVTSGVEIVCDSSRSASEGYPRIHWPRVCNRQVSICSSINWPRGARRFGSRRSSKCQRKDVDLFHHGRSIRAGSNRHVSAGARYCGKTRIRPQRIRIRGRGRTPVRQASEARQRGPRVRRR